MEAHNSGEVQSARWKSPECQRGKTAIVVSDIYSFAMCIVEAVGGSIPWGDKNDEEITSLVAHGHRPALPDNADKSQLQRLLQTMWLFDPSKRPNITSVVKELRILAEQSASINHMDQDPNTEATIGEASANLEDFMFPELGASIPTLLERLKSKSNIFHDLRTSALYTYERVAAVYTRLARAHKRPSDPVVMKFCEVLLSFEGFLRVAVSQKSVLRRAKSQKVALMNKVLHREIDDVLVLLPAVEVIDSIHDWRVRLGNDSDSTTTMNGEPEVEPGQTSEISGPVNLSEMESELMNRNFQQVDLGPAKYQSQDPDTQAHQPWFIPLFQLKYN